MVNRSSGCRHIGAPRTCGAQRKSQTPFALSAEGASVYCFVVNREDCCKCLNNGGEPGSESNGSRGNCGRPHWYAGAGSIRLGRQTLGLSTSMTGALHELTQFSLGGFDSSQGLEAVSMIFYIVLGSSLFSRTFFWFLAPNVLVCEWQLGQSHLRFSSLLSRLSPLT